MGWTYYFLQIVEAIYHLLTFYARISFLLIIAWNVCVNVNIWTVFL
jgi:hypothetical protein